MSHIRLSKERNYGPLIPPNMAHVIIGLEPLETLRILLEYGNEDTVFIVNSRPIAETGGQLYWLDATEMAVGLGDPILLNMIMLGALCGLSLFPLETKDFKNVLEQVFETSKLEINYKALDMGEKLVTEYEN